MHPFYFERPKDEKERLAMLEFHKLEMSADEENASMYAEMNKEHLGKMKIKQGIAMVKRWEKGSLRAIKKLSSDKLMCYSHNEPRSWLKVSC